MRTLAVLPLICSLGLAISACSSDSGEQPNAAADAGADATPPVEAGPDAGADAQGPAYPAFQVDAPQVANTGGDILALPKVVPIYFANDDATFTGNVITALNKLPASKYWPAISLEYGIGALTVAPPVQLVEDAPASITDAQVQTWLAMKVATDASFPPPDANTLYTIFYPSTTALTQGGDAICQVFSGYHGSAPYQAASIAYAVVGRCASSDGRTLLEETFATTTHELIEAATDPYTPPAYSHVDDAHVAWASVLGGTEVGDMCADQPHSFYTPGDVGTIVQRSWSNAAAKAAHDPCQPGDGTPYFNAMPLLTDAVQGGGIVGKGVTIPAGQTKTVEVDLFSDAPTSGPWTVDAVDAVTQKNLPPQLTFSWDRTTGKNGDKLQLSITAPQLTNGVGAFIITSTLGNRKNVWYGLVGN